MVVYGTTFKVCGVVKMEANMHLYTPKMLEIIVQGLESCLFSDQMFAVFFIQPRLTALELLVHKRVIC